jgi:glycosyltransferase involved in cell wall biosynthesis
MQPHSLCFFNSNRPWGGGEQWHLQNALLARDRGYRVSVAACAGGELARRLAGERDIALLPLPIGGLAFLNPLTLWRLASFFRSRAVDTLLLCQPRDVKAGALAAKFAGVRQVVYRRGIAVPVRDRLTNRLLYPRMLDKIIVNSRETKRCLLAENPDLMPDGRIHLIYNGFDVAAFDTRRSAPLVPRRGDAVVIGTAGRLTAQKGQALLLDAAALLMARGLDFRLLVAGAGELEADLKARAHSLGLEGRVEFLGFVSDMKAFHLSLDIFALPSLWEGFGYVLAEAMCMRLPVAAFNVNSIPEVVDHGVTGLLSRPEPSALADNLLRLADDAALRRTFGEAGRARLLERFEAGKTFADLEACLRA